MPRKTAPPAAQNRRSAASSALKRGRVAPPPVPDPRVDSPSDDLDPPDAEQRDAQQLGFDDRADFLRDLRMTAARNAGSELAPTVDRDADASWLRNGVHWTPMEYLAWTMRNPWLEAKDRIAAAKVLMDYAHRKFPAPSLIGSDPEFPLPGVGMRIDVGRLSDIELDQLDNILKKASVAV